MRVCVCEREREKERVRGSWKHGKYLCLKVRGKCTDEDYVSTNKNDVLRTKKLGIC